MASLFHAFVVLMLMLLASLVPGSICPASIVCLMLFTFGIGRRSTQAEAPEDGTPAARLPWVLLVYGMALMLGGVVNLIALFLFAGRK